MTMHVQASEVDSSGDAFVRPTHTLGTRRRQTVPVPQTHVAAAASAVRSRVPIRQTRSADDLIALMAEEKKAESSAESEASAASTVGDVLLPARAKAQKRVRMRQNRERLTQTHTLSLSPRSLTDTHMHTRTDVDAADKITAEQ